MEDLNGWVNIRIYKDQRGIEVAWDTDPNRILSIIGGLEIAKNMAMKSLKFESANNTQEKKHVRLNKDEAMKTYLKLGQTIQQRLLAMQKSADNAEFDISQDLLSIV